MNVWPTTTTVTKMLLAATLKDYGIVSATKVMKGTGQTARVTKIFFNMNKIKVQTCCTKYSLGKIILVMYNSMGTKWQNTPKVWDSELGLSLLLFLLRICFLLDINECTKNQHDCHLDATCSNTEGSWECFCNQGYEKNGTQCEGIL